MEGQMNFDKLKEKIQGVYAIMVTPMHRPYTSEEKLKLREVFDQCGILSG